MIWVRTTRVYFSYFIIIYEHILSETITTANACRVVDGRNILYSVPTSV